MNWCRKEKNPSTKKQNSINQSCITNRQEWDLSIYLSSGGGGHWSNNNTWPTLSTSRQSGTTRREVILHSHHHVELLPGHSGWLLPTQQCLSGSEQPFDFILLLNSTSIIIWNLKAKEMLFAHLLFLFDLLHCTLFC